MFNIPKILIPKPKVKINAVLRKTAGGRHVYCDASVGEVNFEIRKPIGSVKNFIKN